MAKGKCPMCESPCIIKVIATSDERWCEVDVCKMCGTMYPREERAGKAAGARARPKKAAKPKGETARRAGARAKTARKRKG